MTNPLLTPFELPPFSKILPEHVVPAVTKALNDCRENVERVVAQGAPYTWENLCQPLAEVDDVLGRIFSPVSHLNSVKNSPELREAYEQTLPLLSEYSTWVGQHEGLYKAYRDLRDGDHYATLNTAQKKAVDNALRDFELSGIGLPIEKQQRYGEIATRLSELGNQYSNNVLDATMGWTKLVTDEAELAGMQVGVVAQDGVAQDVGGVGRLGGFGFVPQGLQGGGVEAQVLFLEQFAHHPDAEGAVQHLVAHDVLQLLGGAFHQAAPLQREDGGEAVVEPAALEDGGKEEVGERELVQVVALAEVEVGPHHALQPAVGERDLAVDFGYDAVAVVDFLLVEADAFDAVLVGPGVQRFFIDLAGLIDL